MTGSLPRPSESATKASASKENTETQTGTFAVPIKAWLSLGANLGYPKLQLAQARKLLCERGIIILRESSLYDTTPWGKSDQPDFVNQVLEVETALDANALLDKIIEIETDMGRVRTEKWGPRLIDIDILLYGDQIIETGELRIPHPWLHLREFCLDPLCELEPDLLHPVFKKSMQELREALNTGTGGPGPTNPKEES